MAHATEFRLTVRLITFRNYPSRKKPRRTHRRDNSLYQVLKQSGIRLHILPLQQETQLYQGSLTAFVSLISRYPTPALADGHGRIASRSRQGKARLEE